MQATELVDRIRYVLRDMSMLSESDAVRHDGDRVKGGGSKSAPPPKVRLSGHRDLRDLSLAEFWGDRFRKVRGDTHKLTYFLYLAELDLASHKRRPDFRDPHEGTEQREARVLEQYEGLTVLEACVIEGCEELWLRRVRLKHERDPDTGY